MLPSRVCICVRQNADGVTHPPSGDTASTDQFVDNPCWFGTGEFLVKALIAERQAVVVDADLIQQGRVHIADMHRILDDIVTEVVRPAEFETAFDPGPSHPHREAAAVVIPTVIVGCQRTLRINGPAEFTAPHNQRVFEHAALFKVRNQSGDGLVDRFALASE